MCVCATNTHRKYEAEKKKMSKMENKKTETRKLICVRRTYAKALACRIYKQSIYGEVKICHTAIGCYI